MTLDMYGERIFTLYILVPHIHFSVIWHRFGNIGKVYLAIWVQLAGVILKPLLPIKPDPPIPLAPENPELPGAPAGPIAGRKGGGGRGG